VLRGVKAARYPADRGAATESWWRVCYFLYACSHLAAAPGAAQIRALHHLRHQRGYVPLSFCLNDTLTSMPLIGAVTTELMARRMMAKAAVLPLQTTKYPEGNHVFRESTKYSLRIHRWYL